MAVVGLPRTTSTSRPRLRLEDEESREPGAGAGIYSAGRAGRGGGSWGERGGGVGATRSVMDYLFEGARLDPDMSGSMWGTKSY